jgi:hypothetical protein
MYDVSVTWSRAMISSTELLKRTGLKSAKTLTRWYQLGLIPKPELRTHPSGRGKLGYWPDWVLDRCVKMRDAQKRGRSLKGAVSLMALGDVERTTTQAAGASAGGGAISQRRLKVAVEGVEKEYSGLDVFIAMILSDLHPLTLAPDLRDVLVARLRENQALDTTLQRLERGFNPVLVFNGSQAQITADFMVGIQLGVQGEQGRPDLVVPLLHPLRRALARLGDSRQIAPRIQPAMKVWDRDGNNLCELYVHSRPDGYDVVRESARRPVRARAQGKRGGR